MDAGLLTFTFNLIPDSFLVMIKGKRKLGGFVNYSLDFYSTLLL